MNISVVGSSGRAGEGGKKHENYAAAFGGHLYYDSFLQGLGAMDPLAPLDLVLIKTTPKYAGKIQMSLGCPLYKI